MYAATSYPPSDVQEHRTIADKVQKKLLNVLMMQKYVIFFHCKKKGGTNLTVPCDIRAKSA